MNIYKENYKNIKKLFSALKDSAKSYNVIEIKGYLPLLIEHIAQNYDYEIILLAHLYECNGDLMHDPAMEIKVSQKECTAKAISFKQDRFNIYKRADDDKKVEFELNLLLKTWLNNLKAQGFIKESG